MLEKARFIVDVTRPVDLRPEAFGAFSVESRRELQPNDVLELRARATVHAGIGQGRLIALATNSRFAGIIWHLACGLGILTHPTGGGRDTSRLRPLLRMLHLGTIRTRR